ncbi:aldehyde dehydrogenase family protein [Halovenus marina]|uniref:aldehyde dehydrogenase family protein n=1 Tax=Halovenus marina TaxID=3396621 RepID=UPI003F57CF8A
MARNVRTGSVDRYGLFVDGEFDDSSENTFTTIDPATGDTLGELTSGSRDDVQRAIDAAAAVQPELESMTAFERAELCHEVADAMEDNQDELAEWLSRDQGKPLEDAAGEIEGGANLWRMAAEDIKRDEPATHPSENPDKRIYTTRKPHGIVGVITPWNYPVAIPIEYLAPGIACGNSLIWVPAPSTSVIAMKIAEVIQETSIPDGAINVVTGDGATVGNEVAQNAGTHAVGFTGSPATGEAVAQAAGTKPTLLELGGNGPIVVLDDANIEAAVERAVFSCFANSGQDCAGGERVLVDESVHDEFVSQFVERAEEYTVGDPLEDSTDLGPMNNEGVFSKVVSHLDDAREKGATFELEGGPMADAPSDLFLSPSVLTGVTPEMTVFQEETFGPVAPITSFSSEEEAIDLANTHGTGLISGVFTSRIDRAHRFADAIKTGTVHINEGSCYWEQHTPFGGYSGRDSGSGRLGGRYSIEELSQIKNVTIDTGNVRDEQP